MRKSAFTTVFLIAILLTGAITTASVHMIDAEASSDKKDKKKDKERDYEREYDKKDKKKDKERDYEREYYEEDKYMKYEEYDEDKSDIYDGKDKDDDYNKKSNKYDDEYDKPQKELYKSYPKQYSESYDVKSNKKIKIIDCNNLNVNADELEDLQSIEPSIQEAIASNGEEEQQWGSYNEFSQNSPNTRVYYIEPDTKVIFKCNNANHNLIENENDDVSDSTAALSDLETGTFAQATENLDTSLGNATESIESSQSGNMTNNDTNSTIQESSSEQMESPLAPTLPSNEVTENVTSEVPFIFPIPNTID